MKKCSPILHTFIVFAATALATGDARSQEHPQYNRDVRPILSDKCFRCHGPDEAARQGDLRLDERDDATADRGEFRVIAPSSANSSELIRRITSSDVDERMPPPDSSEALSSGEIEILRKWIEQGAKYEEHWSFVPPVRPSPPNTKDDQWSRSAIDEFVLARLGREGLKPSSTANATMLIRRVTLDLTGLPPTIEEVDAFLAEWDHRPDVAYEQLVDRLLQSPSYGERMASGWLDAARYADTNGYFTDNDRTMWPWRDWVINAFNDNMPFDRFTIEQLAGDLLPKSTLDQKIATGFNRNHMVNNETGIIEEEFRVEYVVDRVDTTATVWMGLTLGCARCHDHKYDPISQKDFYRFFSFFNNVPERGLSGSSGNSVPLLKVPVAQLQERLDEARRIVAKAEQEFASLKMELDAAQSEWETTASEHLPEPPTSDLVKHYTLDEGAADDLKTGSVTQAEGMIGMAAKFSGDGCIHISDSVDFERTDAFSFGAWIQPASAGCIVSKMDDENDMRGIDVTLRKGKALVNLVHGWNRNAIQVATVASLPMRRWQHLFVTYDGSSRAAGVKIYVDGQVQAVSISEDSLTGTIRNSQPLRIGRRQASASLKGLVDDLRFYDRALSSDEVSRLATGQSIRSILAIAPQKRSEQQKQKLQSWFLQQHADERFALAKASVDELRARVNSLAKNMPTTMVMQESEKPREAFVLIRGEYDQHGEKVTAGVPEFLSVGRLANPSGAADGSDESTLPTNRLDLAKWLVDPSHPLTARVIVNRIWQQLFGIGIVKTVDDFGTQGNWPSHPELLDWLAMELIESGWDVKHLLRTIVTSATYRQSSHASPEHYASDPENRLLARGPRFRMDAEMLHDNALAISGLFVQKIGGPPVKPYQPAGLWEEVTYDSDSSYEPDRGASLYRRSLYTFWRRQAPPPNMLVFDAPTRETCTVARSNTNTPLQALALMNDPTFVEAARNLAERTLLTSSDDVVARIEYAFRSATARRPNADEVEVLLDVLQHELRNYKQHPNVAAKLVSVGQSKHSELTDIPELAAWTTVASMILSLDETITRQ